MSNYKKPNISACPICPTSQRVNIIKKEHDEDNEATSLRGAKAKYIVYVRGGIPQDMRRRISALQAKALTGSGRGEMLRSRRLSTK